MKNMKKMLATAMVLVMALSAVIIVSGDSSEAATDITYISGKIMDDQEYKAGAIVVQNGDLSIEAGKKLTIAQGASFTVASGYTLTVNDEATFKVNNGALVVVDGKLNVKSGGMVVNGSIFDNTSKVDGKLAGFFVNGEMNVAKKAAIFGSVPSQEIIGTGSWSAGLNVEVADSVDKSEMSTSITNPTIHRVGNRIVFTGDIPVHMNGAGNWGAWVGIKVTELNTASITTVIDGRSQKYNIENGTDYFYTTAGKAVQVSISYSESGTTVKKTFILDATGVNVLGPSGQIIVNGALTTTSSGLTHSSVEDQIISISETGKVSLKGDVSGTVVSAFTDSKNPYTYGAVFVNAAEFENGTNNVVDLDFTTKSEKISLAFLVDSGDDDSTKKAQNMILDVSGSIQGSYVAGTSGGGTNYSVTMTVLETIPSAGVENGEPKVLYYSDGTTNDPKSSGVPMAGKVSVNESLSVGRNATFEVEEGAILDVFGKITVDGVKNASNSELYNRAGFVLNGIMNVTGTVKIGSIVSDDIGAVGLDVADAYIIVENEGVISIQDAELDGISKAFGAAFVDEDNILWMMSLPAAIAAAEAGDVSEVSLWSIAAEEQTIQKKDYKITSDLEIPDGINLNIMGTVVISSGSTMTIKDGADISGNCLLDVKGMLVDGTLMSGNDLYLEKLASGTTGVHVKADVKSVDEDETAYKYTTLKSALGGVDSRIELFGNVSISGTLTIPQDKTVVLGERDLTIKTDSELIVDGVLVANDDGKLKMANANGNKAAAVLSNNNMIVATDVCDGSNNPKKVSGIYAEGTIGDYKESEFILAPAVAAENSKTLANLVIREKTNVSAKLVFTAADDADDAVITIEADAVFGEVTLEGYSIVIGNGAKVTASLIAETTSGMSAVQLDEIQKLTFKVIEDDSGDEVVENYVIVVSPGVQELSGNLTISQGVVYIHGDLGVGKYQNKKGNVLTVATGAELVIPKGSEVASVANGSANEIPLGYAGLVIDGKLSVVEGTLNAVAGSADDGSNTIDGVILVNGELFISGTTDNLIHGSLLVKGTLNMDMSDKAGAKLKIIGELIVGEKPESLGAVASVIGVIEIPDGSATLIVYPGADMSRALINYDPSTGESTIKKVDFMIGENLYMTAYGTSGGIIPVPENEVVITGYEPINSWFVDPDCQTAVENEDTVDDYSVIYALAIPSKANIKVSIGTGMSLWIDGLKYDNGKIIDLEVGTYNVEVTIDPGYKGTVRITFDGIQITDGKMVVTPEMSSRAAVDSGNFIVLSATGDISVDSGSVPVPTPVTPAQDDDSMGITEYLLIVLVVLAAILVVVVAIRMMRS